MQCDGDRGNLHILDLWGGGGKGEVGGGAIGEYSLSLWPSDAAITQREWVDKNDSL